MVDPRETREDEPDNQEWLNELWQWAEEMERMKEQRDEDE